MKRIILFITTPQMDENVYNDLLNNLTDRGYDVNNLTRV
jgi:lipocalin